MQNTESYSASKQQRTQRVWFFQEKAEGKDCLFLDPQVLSLNDAILASLFWESWWYLGESETGLRNLAKKIPSLLLNMGKIIS